MGINFHGVQIFVDFVGSLHPRKFYFALMFGASRDRFPILVTDTWTKNYVSSTLLAPRERMP